MSNKNCILCFLEFNSFERSPKILKCGHTFCLECLTKIYNRNNERLECPKCREECSDKPTDLLTVFDLINTLESDSESKTIYDSNSISSESIAITESSSELNYKIGLVGNQGTGKTSIIKRYLNDKYEEYLQPTINAGFHFKNIKLRNHNVKLEIRDTAGQEKYFSITNSYLRGLDGIFLVFAVNDVNSFNSIPYWLKKCKDVIGEDKILFLMGNKTDKEKKISNAQAREFAENHHMRYCHTSAFNGDNIEDAFYDMTKKIYQNNKKIQKNQIIQKNDESIKLSKDKAKGKNSCWKNFVSGLKNLFKFSKK